MTKTIHTPSPSGLRIAALLAVAAAAALWAASTPTDARERGFANPSLRGAYALVGNGGANEAASVGITRFDGAGGASRSLVLNQADPNGTGRLILTIPATGTYAVQPDGTGTAVFLNELPDGSLIPFHFDFVVTDARSGGGRGSHLATKLHMVQREAGVAAKLVVFDLSRLPD